MHRDLSQPSSDFERVGGLSGLEAIMAAFVSRLTQDVMIGFFFARTVPQRLIAGEVHHAAGHLGGPAYTGPSMAKIHARSPITGGHFARRRRILAETLAACGVPGDVARRWLGHQDSLRGQVVGASTACPSDG